jgi:hypothetical protein
MSRPMEAAVSLVIAPIVIFMVAAVYVFDTLEARRVRPEEVSDE